MVIECCFGVLKACFPILKLMPTYRPKKQCLIVIAYCTIHTYICTWERCDTLFHEWENISTLNVDFSMDLSNERSLSNNNHLEQLSNEIVVVMLAYCDHITNWM